MYVDPSGEIAITALIFYLAIASGIGVLGYIAVDSYNETGRVDWENAIVNGLLTFGTVYFTGMYLYSCYLTFSFMYGLNPVIGFGPGGLQFLYNTGNISQSVQLYYPPNQGFKGKPVYVTLEPGTYLDRFGGPEGRYVSPSGTPSHQLSLPFDKAGVLPRTYEVIRPIPGVQSGITSPWFDQIGGGTQYLLPESIQYYIKHYFMR